MAWRKPKRKNMNKIIASAIAATVLGASAFAGGPVEVETVEVEAPLTGLYIGGAYTANSAELALGDYGMRLASGQDNDGITFIGGYNFNDFVAVEARYTSLFESDFIEGNTWSLFVKPQYPVSPEAKVYALIGYGGVTFDDIDYGNIIDDETGFQYGIGAAYSVTTNVEIFADYTVDYDDTIAYVDDVNLDLTNDALTFGVNYKF